MAQHLAQQGQQQGVYRELVRRNVLAVALLHKVLPQVLRNLEGAGDFIAQLQAPGDAVVRLGLLGGLGGGQGGEAAELFSRNQAALDADGGVGELLGVLACHGSNSCCCGHQHVNTHHIHRQAGGDLVAAPGIGGFANAAVVGQQGLGAGFGDFLQGGLPGGQAI